MIPLLRLAFGEEERAALGRVLASGMLIQGPTVEAFENAVRARCRREHAVAVTNGTAALELALRALDVGPGDEVLCPNVTWPSPGHAIFAVGARPVLVDVDLREWNAAPEAFAKARTPRTKAAIVIDQFGFPARVTAVGEALPGVRIVEDAACAIGSTLHGAPSGSFGHIACLSFHPRKVVTTGEGGMCLTDDGALAARLRVLRNHGQRTPGDFVEASGNQRLNELAAALGLAQLAQLDAFMAARQAQAARYHAALPALTFQALPPGATTNHQTLGALLPDGTTATKRDAFLEGLRRRGVAANFLSYALHRLPAFAEAQRHAEARGERFLSSSTIVDRGVALPCFPGLTEAEQATVISAVGDAVDEL